GCALLGCALLLHGAWRQPLPSRWPSSPYRLRAIGTARSWRGAGASPTRGGGPRPWQRGALDAARSLRARRRTACIALKALRRRFHGDAPTGYRWLRRCCWYTSPFDRIYRPALAPYPTPCHGYCLRVRQDTPTGSRPRRDAADRRTGSNRRIANVTPV